MISKIFMNSVPTLILSLSQVLSTYASANTQQEHDYLDISTLLNEPAIISTYRTNPLNSWRERGLAPRGSAALTSSGALAANGIQYILHAASGSMAQSDPDQAPTLDGVKLSIINSIRIADRMEIRRIAIPLIGGGIFLNSLGITKDELAIAIIDAAQSVRTRTEIIFVAYSESDGKILSEAHAQQRLQQKNLNWAQRIVHLIKSILTTRQDFFKRSHVVVGSIVDFNTHGASAIVNAANMELTFGGGISGVIGKATQAEDQINLVGQRLIQEFYLK